MECIENFKAMQNCFREHPDEYGEELAPPEGGDEEGVDEGREEGASPGEVLADAVTPVARSGEGEKGDERSSASSVGRGVRREEGKEADEVTERAKRAKEQVEKDHGDPLSESDMIVPKASHDAR